MVEKIDFMVRFWQLRARHEALGTSLTASERAELLSLLRLMSPDMRLPEAGPPPRSDRAVPVQLTAPGGFISAELRMVCADGVVLACASILRPNTRTIVRLADAISGFEYTMPCTVEWSHVGRPSALGLRVDGAPARSSFSIPAPGMWRSPLRWTEPPWTIAE